MVREFTVGTDRSFAATFMFHRNGRATDEVLNGLTGVITATSNRRLTGDPQSTAERAIDGDTSTAWTTPFSNVVGSRIQIPLDSSTPTRPW